MEFDLISNAYLTRFSLLSLCVQVLDTCLDCLSSMGVSSMRLQMAVEAEKDNLLKAAEARAITMTAAHELPTGWRENESPVAPEGGSGYGARASSAEELCRPGPSADRLRSGLDPQPVGSAAGSRLPFAFVSDDLLDRDGAAPIQ